VTSVNLVDLIAAKALEQLEATVEPRITAAAAEARATAERQISEWLNQNGGQVTVAPNAVPDKTDARNRAQRTAIQGVISTVVVAVLLAVSGVIGGDGFDWTNLSDWKAVGGAVLGAVLMTVTAYVHRLVSPPGSEPKG
jgi:hypothetical protein